LTSSRSVQPLSSRQNRLRGEAWSLGSLPVPERQTGYRGAYHYSFD
jgi:hypothetical protein